MHPSRAAAPVADHDQRGIRESQALQAVADQRGLDPGKRFNQQATDRQQQCLAPASGLWAREGQSFGQGRGTNKTTSNQEVNQWSDGQQKGPIAKIKRT